MKIIKHFGKWITLAIFIFILVPSSVNAQDEVVTGTAFDRAFEDYKLKLEVYKKEHDEYILKRSQYLKFGTLTSKNEARDATREMLTARDDVVIVYLNALKERLLESDRVEVSVRDRLLARIDEEMTWFSDHKTKMIGASTLEDLVSDSNEAKQRYNSLAPLIYEILTQIPYSRVARFHERFNENFQALRDKISQIEQDQRDDYKLSTDKIKTIDRWVTESIVKSERSTGKFDKTKVIVDKFANSNANYPNAEVMNTNVLNQLRDSVEDLKEASLNLIEIISEIKTD